MPEFTPVKMLSPKGFEMIADTPAKRINFLALGYREVAKAPQAPKPVVDSVKPEPAPKPVKPESKAPEGK